MRHNIHNQVVIVEGERITLTPETVLLTRRTLANNQRMCIEEILDGSVRVNNKDEAIKYYRKTAADYLKGKNDKNLNFVQRAIYLQTNEMVPILS